MQKSLKNKILKPFVQTLAALKSEATSAGDVRQISTVDKIAKEMIGNSSTRQIA